MMNWLYCTIIFGSLPIVIRLIVSLSASDSQIPLFSLSDFAFWGIMFNIAAITNATHMKKVSSDLIVGIVSVAIIHIVLFVTIYCIALFPSINHGVLWTIGTVILISSFIFSHETTDREFMHSIQMALEMANTRDKMHPIMKEYLKHIDERIKHGENPKEGEGIVEFFDSYGLDIDPNTLQIRRKSYDNVKSPDGGKNPS